ncbi:hypothetical protein LY76DRAFT_214819 [Colletotrichum caudatum]|nr:hypothetical protein LY76DRAFT_214819 [Colletotrichum caudatum]
MCHTSTGSGPDLPSLIRRLARSFPYDDPITATLHYFGMLQRVGTQGGRNRLDNVPTLVPSKAGMGRQVYYSKMRRGKYVLYTYCTFLLLLCVAPCGWNTPFGGGRVGVGVAGDVTMKTSQATLWFRDRPARQRLLRAHRVTWTSSGPRVP